jgi:hypothetical protein
MGDSVGMGLAVELLFHSSSAIPRMKGEKHIQFDSMRKPRGSFSLWESSPMGIKEGSMFSSNMAKVTITSCPTQQKWFSLIMRGAESRMCWTSRRQQHLGVGVIVRLLTLIKEEAKDQEPTVAREYYKVGAAVATALCSLLRGSEVFMLELAALWRHIKIGHDGTLPLDPLKAGIDLSTAPHVIITLLGEFKGELGFKYHLVFLASTTSMGI